MNYLRWNEKEDGFANEVSLRFKLEQLGFRPTRQTLPPGNIVPLQRFPDQRTFAVIHGVLICHWLDRYLVLNVGDVVVVPEDTLHAIYPMAHQSVSLLTGCRVGTAALLFNHS